MWSRKVKDDMIITFCNLCEFEINSRETDKDFVFELMKSHIQICPGRGR